MTDHRIDPAAIADVLIAASAEKMVPWHQRVILEKDARIAELEAQLAAESAAADARTLKAVEAMRAECKNIVERTDHQPVLRQMRAIDAAAIIAGVQS